MSKKRREKKLRTRNKGLTKRIKRPKVEDILSPMSLFHQPSLSSFNPPEGFRTITATQSMMIFAEPLREYLKDNGIEAMNIMMGIATDIWNYTLSKVPANQKKTQEEFVEQICESLSMNETDAIDLFEHLIERKAHLFPDEIQPDDVRTMFMRNEREYQIETFDESQLEFLEDQLPPTSDDQDMLEKLQRLDEMLADGEDYDAWEDLYFQVEEACCTRYYEWLKAKTVQPEYADIFPYCIERFLDFVYRYDAGALNSVAIFEVEDFLLDHLLRKVMIKPEEYVYWPPALRLFYTFLTEKGYLDDPQPFIDLFNDVEIGFIELLKKQF